MGKLIRTRARLVAGFAVVALILVCGTIAFSGGTLLLTPTDKDDKLKRKLQIKTPKDFPLSVTKVKNLQKKGDWLKDLAIEVTNVSDKPIYFIALGVEFPDMPVSGNPDPEKYSRVVYGFTLIYGNPELGDVRTIATEEDKPLLPGESYVFTVPERKAEGVEKSKELMSAKEEAADNIIINFDTMSFGDGTGFSGGRKKGIP